MTTGKSGVQRSPYMDAPYFDEQVQYNEESLSKFRDVVADPTTEATHRKRLLQTIFRRSVEDFIARYSRGDDIGSLRSKFPQVVNALSACSDAAASDLLDFQYFDGYVYGLWLIALAILLDIDEQSCRVILNGVDNRGKDALFDQLAGTLGAERPTASDLLYGYAYEPLYSAFDASREERPRNVKRFLDGYYKNMRKAYWHDRHRRPDAGFFGYWAFEAAAVVKVLKIDDREFADNAYYPRDLVQQGSD